MLHPQSSLWILVWGRINIRKLMVGRTWHILPGCHTVSHTPGPPHKLPWPMARCATSAMCNPRADPVLDCIHGKYQHCEKGNRRMVRVFKEKSLFVAWINSDNEVNKLTSDSFLQPGFQRIINERWWGCMCVLGQGYMERKNFVWGSEESMV